MIPLLAAVYYSRDFDTQSLWPPPSDDLNSIRSSTADTALDDAATSYCNLTDALSLNIRQVDSSTRVAVSGSVNLYQPLHSGSTIRLLELEAGIFQDPFHVCFHLADLQAGPVDYEAISYVWGQTTSNTRGAHGQTQRVMCGTQSIPISRNLSEALRYIRYSDRSRMIWVDALCINQTDDKERGHQVTLMSKVYSTAKRVIIWLSGRTTQTRNKADFYENSAYDPYPDEEQQIVYESLDARGQFDFRAVSMVANTWLTERSLDASATYLVNTRDSRVHQGHLSYLAGGESYGLDFAGWSQGDQQSDELLWMAIKDLYQCQWFWRVWIVQEAVLASCAVVKMGNVEMDWRWVGLTAAILRTNCDQKVRSLNLGGLYNAYLLFRMSRMSDLRAINVNFLQLLRLTRQLRSTDKRDRVYGLLGLDALDNKPREGKVLITPDYEIDHRVLWRRLACALINSMQNLSVLSSVQHTRINEDRSSTGKATHRGQKAILSTLEEGIPSWVPQWDNVNRASLLPWDPEEKFSASETMPLVLGVDPASGSLVVQGMRIGEIGCIFESLRDLMEDPDLAAYSCSESGVQVLSQTLSAGRNSYGTLTSVTEANPVEFILDVFEYFAVPLSSVSDRSFLNSHVKQLMNAGRSSYDSYYAPYEWNYKRDIARVAKHKELVDQFYTNRRLCLTLNGYLILAPDVLQEGDLLYVLPGSDIPMLLRPLKAVTRADPHVKLPVFERPELGIDRYVLVGECYVDGLMLGEAVSATSLHGPVPLDLVTEYVLSLAAKNVEDDQLWSFKARETTELNEQQKQILVAAGRDAIRQEQQRKTSLEWLEIV